MLAPGLEQWEGEEGGQEKGDSLRIDRGEDDYVATKCRLLRPPRLHPHPSPGLRVQAERPQRKPNPRPRLPVMSKCCPPHPLSLRGSSRDPPLFKLAMEK